MTLPTLGGLLQERATTTPTRVPVQFVGPDGSRAATDYAQLHHRAMSIADALRQRMCPGDRVLLMYPSGPEFVSAFFGCLAAGVIPVATPPPLPGPMAERLRHIASDCTPRLLLTVDSWVPLAGDQGVPTLATDGIAGDGAASMSTTSPAGSPNDVAYLQYSSGTTGLPRGVMITHANALANCAMIAAVFGPRSDDVNVGWMPLFHDFGLVNGILAPIFEDRTNIVFDPLLFVRDPLRWLRELHSSKAAFASLPPFACELLLRRVAPEVRAELDLSAMRALGIAAEVLSDELLAEFVDGFAAAGLADTAVLPCYGLAEAVTVVASTPPGVGRRTMRVNREALTAGKLTPDPCGIALAGSGKPVPGVELRIVDPLTRTELPPGHVGEILIAGPNVTPGYWGLPDPGLMFDHARHLPTGDLGAFVDNELFVLDRLGDRITVDGRDHYPSHVERTARSVDAQIRRCVAFGVENSLALVVEVDESRVDEQSGLADRVGESVARVHRVRVEQVRIVRKGALPVTTSGKPRRGACRDSYLADIRVGR
jgi:acyl-CoA synthetase (AMP-forming)/AMP-acid ligase II